MSSNKLQGRVDPLELLRSSYLNKKRIKQKDNMLIFDKDIKLNLNTQTPWFSSITNKQYSLGSIWLLLESQLQKVTDYFQKVSQLKVDAVSIADKDQMVKYFIEGSIKQTNCINQQLKLNLIQRNIKRDQPSSGFQPIQQQMGKKVKVDIQIDFQLQVMDYLMRFQKPTGSKTRSLRYPEKSFESILKTLHQNQSTTSIEREGKTRLTYFHDKKRVPIIIVPEFQNSGNVSIHNIEKLLVSGQYEEKQVVQNPHIRKTQIQHYIKEKKVTFEVTNNPSLLSKNDWEFVVAIFVNGRKSQFQDWPIKQPSQIFQKAKGFLVKYANSRTEDANDWNVRTVIIDKHTRYRDQQIKKYIWEEIQSFLLEKL